MSDRDEVERAARAWLACTDSHKGSLYGFACGYRAALARHRDEGVGVNYVRQIPFKWCACAGCLADDPLHHPYLCQSCYAKVVPVTKWEPAPAAPKCGTGEVSSRSAAQSGIRGINHPCEAHDDAGAQPLGAKAGSCPGDDTSPPRPVTPDDSAGADRKARALALLKSWEREEADVVEAIRADELERCEKVCDDMVRRFNDDGFADRHAGRSDSNACQRWAGAIACRDAIRALRDERGGHDEPDPRGVDREAIEAPKDRARLTPADLMRSLAAIEAMIDGATSLDNVARIQRERDEAQKALVDAYERCAKYAEGCDKSTHPAEVADGIRALRTAERGECAK